MSPLSTSTPTPAASATPRPSILTERYLHAVTRRLPEAQRDDVAEELRASIADRAEALREAGLASVPAERAALEELGDPDALAAGYTGRQLQLIGPATYPAYVRTLRAILVSAVPAATLVVAALDVLDGESLGNVLGGAAWLAFTLVVQISFWTTLVFVVAERGSAPRSFAEELAWTPDDLPELPSSRGSLGETVTNVAFLAVLGALIVGQQLRPAIDAPGGDVPVLDPDLWSGWLPLVLVALVAEAAFEVIRYRLGGWTPRLAGLNVVTGALFAAPVLYLAASDRLLNPAAVAGIQEHWSDFDAGQVHTVVIVVALLSWAWDSIEGWRKVRAA